MSHIVDRQIENNKKLFIVNFHQNLRKRSSLEMVHFFLRSVYYDKQYKVSILKSLESHPLALYRYTTTSYTVPALCLHCHRFLIIETSFDSFSYLTITLDPLLR